MAAADDELVKLPATTLTSRVYDKLEAREEYSELDFSVVLRWLEESNAGFQPGSGYDSSQADEVIKSPQA
jgi:hypothetical protein